jgi:type IV pilus assembly protein PilZ
VSERRSYERLDVEWSVDCETEQTFLYASITNISEMGIFVATQEPLEVGTRLTLRFAVPGQESPFILLGQVAWVNPIRLLSDNPNPGMGIRFVDLSPESRERIIKSVRTIAYVRDNTN